MLSRAPVRRYRARATANKIRAPYKRRTAARAAGRAPVDGGHPAVALTSNNAAREVIAKGV